MIRIASINFYAANKQALKDIGKIVALKAHSVGLQEANNHVEIIRDNAVGYRTIWSQRPQIWAREVPIMVRSDLPVHRWWARRISKQVEPVRIAKARGLTVVRYEAEGERVAHINTHLNAAVQDKKTGLPKSLRVPRVREFVKSVIILDNVIRNNQAAGYKVVVTGDMNYRRYKGSDKFVLWFFSPQRVFRRNNLNWVERGLDYVGFDKSLVPKKVKEIYNTGSDHPWIVVDLVPAPPVEII